jgi:SAM-dependent methyltransferase
MPERPDFISKKEEIMREVDERGGFHYSADFVSPETYQELFSRLDVRGKKILDLGAGDVPIHPIADHGSHYTDALKGKGALLIPFDRHDGRMRTWLLGKGLDRRIKPPTTHEPVVGDARSLPFGDASIDGAISINFLNSFQVLARSNVRAILRETSRILKPGAFFTISTFGYHDVTLRTADGTTERFSPSFSNGVLPRPNDLITPEVLKELAEQSGFTLQEELPIDPSRVEDERAHIKKFYQEQGQEIDTEMLHPIAVVFIKKP